MYRCERDLRGWVYLALRKIYLSDTRAWGRRGRNPDTDEWAMMPNNGKIIAKLYFYALKFPEKIIVNVFSCRFSLCLRPKNLVK